MNLWPFFPNSLRYILNLPPISGGGGIPISPYGVIELRFASPAPGLIPIAWFSCAAKFCCCCGGGWWAAWGGWCAAGAGEGAGGIIPPMGGAGGAGGPIFGGGGWPMWVCDGGPPMPGGGGGGAWPACPIPGRVPGMLGGGGGGCRYIWFRLSLHVSLNRRPFLWWCPVLRIPHAHSTDRHILGWYSRCNRWVVGHSPTHGVIRVIQSRLIDWQCFVPTTTTVRCRSACLWVCSLTSRSTWHCWGRTKFETMTYIIQGLKVNGSWFIL